MNICRKFTGFQILQGNFSMLVHTYAGEVCNTNADLGSCPALTTCVMDVAEQAHQVSLVRGTVAPSSPAARCAAGCAAGWASGREHILGPGLLLALVFKVNIQIMLRQ